MDGSKNRKIHESQLRCLDTSGSMMGDRELLSKALVVECVRPNGLPMVGDLKKMHGGCYIIVMDYHFLQANASLFVGTIGH